MAAVLILPPSVSRASPKSIELLFEFSSAEVSLTLRAMHSVLHIQGPDDHIATYHTSFTEFLFDESRSKHFHIHKLSQHELLARRWLRLLVDRVKIGSGTGSPWYGGLEWTGEWADFCFTLGSPPLSVLRELDNLYTTILSTCSHCDMVVSILAVVLVLPTDKASPWQVTPEIIDRLSEYPAAQVASNLRQMRPVLLGGQHNLDPVSVSHFSFTNFLLDQSRSHFFFIDTTAHRTRLVRRLLHSQHQEHRDARTTLTLWSWYEFCLALEMPENDIASELDTFYNEVLSTLSGFYRYSSIIDSIIVLSRYTQTSRELIELLLDLSQEHEVRYYLRIGETSKFKDVNPHYSSFFGFLQNKALAPNYHADPKIRDYLARRCLHVLLQLVCKSDPLEKFESYSISKFLWDEWANFCSTCVDRPSIGLTPFGAPKRPSPAPLRSRFDRFSPLFHRFERVSSWLKAQDDSGKLFGRSLEARFAAISTRFHFTAGRPFRPSQCAVTVVLDIAECKYDAGLSAICTIFSSRLELPTLSVECKCQHPMGAPQAFLFPVEGPVPDEYHVDIRAACVVIVEALAKALESTSDSKGVVLNVLDSSVLPRCGSDFNALHLFRIVLEKARKITWTTPLKDLVSDHNRDKLLLWLQSFPRGEHSQETNVLRDDFLDLLS
ncbi:hypothetical protein AAF712_005921 [Marasmius tenuissimus]|uniref:Uncharacterized protein n=1 Tax=Marasmius tenuissimus TaxID=585030 RepID=A0ABR2ZYZ9_9AGAR